MRNYKLIELAAAMCLVHVSQAAKAQEPPTAVPEAKTTLQPPGDVGWMEGYPDRVQAALEARDRRRLRETQGMPSYAVNYLVQRRTLWEPGQTVRVAFRGGDAALHKKIEDVASAWNGKANIVLDFGAKDASQPRRTWSETDKSYAAEIRVAFDGPGYWSFVGTDSVDGSVAPPSATSLNLAGFDAVLPRNWAAVVLHEFGHALGYSHEHQTPNGGCDQEFQWENRPDGTPGIYTALGRAPNWWPRAKVDQNLRQFAPSFDFVMSPRDSLSIMHYHFPEWMFVRGKNSPCCVPENVELSKGDMEGLLVAYPREAKALEEREREVEKRLMEVKTAREGRGLRETFLELDWTNRKERK